MTTSSRRDFVSIAAASSALAASGVLSGGILAASADTSQGGGQGGRYVPPVKFGLGGVPFGNEFEVVSDENAYQTLEAAWNAGVRYYDVAPWYGLGLGERRSGNFLHKKTRDDYILPAKVCKLLKSPPYNDAESNFPFSPYKPPCCDILAHHRFGHIAPADAFLEQHVLRAEIGEPPGLGSRSLQDPAPA